MPLETAHRNQKAVYLEATGLDTYGNRTVATAVEIDVRWQNVQQEIVDNHGDTQAIDAKIVVDRVVPLGSILWEGILDDYSASTSVDYVEVIGLQRAMDIKGRNVRRVLLCKRYNDTVPAST